MFKKLSEELQKRFARRDNLSKQVEIVWVFDLCKKEIAKYFPDLKPRPISLKNKTLTIQLESSAAANELRHKEREILQQINKELQKETVTRFIYRF